MSHREHHRMGALMLWPQLCLWTNLTSLQGKNEDKKNGSSETGNEKLGYEEAICNASPVKIKN